MPENPTKQEVEQAIASFEGNALEKIYTINPTKIPVIYHLEGIQMLNTEYGIAKIPCAQNEDGDLVVSGFSFKVRLPLHHLTSNAQIRTDGAIIANEAGDDGPTIEVIENLCTQMNATDFPPLPPRISDNKSLQDDAKNQLNEYKQKRLIIFPHKIKFRKGIRQHWGIEEEDITLEPNDDLDEYTNEQKLTKVNQRSLMIYNGTVIRKLYICSPPEGVEIPEEAVPEEEE